MKKHAAQLVLLALIVLCGAIYLLVPSVNAGINGAVSAMSSMGVDGVVAYLRGFGPWAAVVSFCLMVLQSVIAPIPAFLITLSNAAIFGWVKGAILSWTSAMVGAALCFWIARIFGRDLVEKIVKKGSLEQVDEFFEKYGKFAILVCRLLPFVSFDVVSYAAGLTSMGFAEFLLATGIGQLPATLVYSYVGGTLTGGAQALFIGLMVLFAISITIGVAKKVYDDRKKKKALAKDAQ